VIRVVDMDRGQGFLEVQYEEKETCYEGKVYVEDHEVSLMRLRIEKSPLSIYAPILGKSATQHFNTVTECFLMSYALVAITLFGRDYTFRAHILIRDERGDEEYAENPSYS